MPTETARQPGSCRDAGGEPPRGDGRVQRGDAPGVRDNGHLTRIHPGRAALRSFQGPCGVPGGGHAAFVLEVHSQGYMQETEPGHRLREGMQPFGPTVGPVLRIQADRS